MATKVAKAGTDAAPVPPASLTRNLGEERDALLQFFDSGCLHAHEAGETVIPWETLQAGRMARLDEEDIDRHFQRTAEVHKWRGKAGTAADLTADEAALATATETARKETPGLREKLDEIAAEIKALEDAERVATETLSRREQARGALRTMCSPWVQERANRAQARVSTEFRDVVIDESRLRVIEGAAQAAVDARGKIVGSSEWSALKNHLEAAAGDPDHPEAAVLAGKALREEARVVGVPRGATWIERGGVSHAPRPEGESRTHITESIDEIAVSRYLSFLESERVELEPRLAARRGLRDAALEEAREALDHYLTD